MSVTSGALLTAVNVRPENWKVVRSRGSRPQVPPDTVSGHSWTLRRAASRITWPSMPTRVFPIAYTGHWQMNSSGPVGGSGRTHHRKT